MNAVRTALLLASCIALGACSEGSAKRKSEPPPVPVTATQAVVRDISIRLQVVGRAEAYESVALKSRDDIDALRGDVIAGLVARAAAR